MPLLFKLLLIEFVSNQKGKTSHIAEIVYRYVGLHTVVSSVADPGFLSRIPERIFPSRIQDQKYSGSRIRIRIKEFKYFNSKNLF
jgi:hypothetical protein